MRYVIRILLFVIWWNPIIPGARVLDFYGEGCKESPETFLPLRNNSNWQSQSINFGSMENAGSFRVRELDRSK